MRWLVCGAFKVMDTLYFLFSIFFSLAVDAAGKLDLFDHLIGGMVKFLFGGNDAEQVNNEGQQQDSDEDEDHRTEIVGLAPLVVQHLPGFLKENRNHHLY